MLFFAHIGLSIAFVFLVFLLLKDKVDYRFVIIGSLLPDMIDKPLGQYIFYSFFQNGRIICHTLLFIAVLVLIGMYVTKRYKFNGFEFLALGAMLHLTEDEIWNAPGTLFWPLFGWEFPKFETGDYLWYLLDKLFARPDIYVPELIGLGICIGFVYYYRLYRVERLKVFLLSGTLSSSRNQQVTPTYE